MDAQLSRFYAGRLQQIFLYVTYRCNLLCGHCLIGDRHGNSYTSAELRGILDIAKAHGARKVTLLGGEPTVHPELPRVIADAKAAGYFVVLDTNGSFRMSLFRNRDFTKVDTLSFSVDGHSAAVHDRIRGLGSFDKAAMRIRAAQENDIKVKITHTVCRRNIDWLIEMFDFAAALDIGELNFHLATFNGRARGPKSQDIVTPREWYVAYRRLHAHVALRGLGNLILRVPPRYCTVAELERDYSDHECVAHSADRLLILPMDGSTTDVGGPLYACGLLVGERATLGWNIAGDFQFSREGGEYDRYHAAEIPRVGETARPVCPIMYNDTENANYLEEDRYVPLCISYKPPLLRSVAT
ncbi:MAG: radical SAM protein [Thermoanaerobaculia bacterium]